MRGWRWWGGVRPAWGVGLAQDLANPLDRRLALLFRRKGRGWGGTGQSLAAVGEVYGIARLAEEGEVGFAVVGRQGVVDLEVTVDAGSAPARGHESPLGLKVIILFHPVP